MQAAHPADHVIISEQLQAAARAELHAILNSKAFRGSRRCCRFLEYSAEHVLRGIHPEELRERNMGVEVFQRSPDYDTSEDAIVRVTANEVRKRLAQYYQESGEHSDPVITLPPGSYAVVFRWREPDATPIQAAVASPPSQSAGKNRLAVTALVLGALAASGLLAYALRAKPTAAPMGASDPLWSKIFRAGEKTNVITADAARFEIQELLTRDITLADYLSPDYPQNLTTTATPELKRAIRFMGTRQTTSVGSMNIGSRLLEFGKRWGTSAVLRHPRHVNVREFQTDNFILLGSRLAIPWVEMFEPSLNFVMKIDPATWHFYLENKSPQQGEALRYERSIDQTYVDVALLPNTNGTGTVLILNSIDMMGVEAAGEFAMSGALIASLKHHMVKEILLRVRSIGGAPSKLDIVATRG